MSLYTLKDLARGEWFTWDWSDKRVQKYFGTKAENMQAGKIIAFQKVGQGRQTEDEEFRDKLWFVPGGGGRRPADPG